MFSFVRRTLSMLSLEVSRHHIEVVVLICSVRQGSPVVVTTGPTVCPPTVLLCKR